jgi:integrase
MCLHDRLHDGQARAAGLPAARLLQAVERLEHPLQLVIRDTRTDVVDDDFDGSRRREQRDHYLSPVETLALLVTTGARKQEVLRARWEHVDLDRSMLTVPRAKSGHPRHIPLSPFAAAIVRRQLALREGDGAWVFPSPTLPDRPLANVKRVWAAAKRAAGLPAGTVIHDLRHSFASALANAGVPLFEIGRVLGHAQLSTTTRYAHHAPERLVATAALAWHLAVATVDATAA